MPEEIAAVAARRAWETFRRINGDVKDDDSRRSCLERYLGRCPGDVEELISFGLVYLNKIGEPDDD